MPSQSPAAGESLLDVNVIVLEVPSAMRPPSASEGPVSPTVIPVPVSNFRVLPSPTVSIGRAPKSATFISPWAVTVRLSAKIVSAQNSTGPRIS